MPEPQIDESFMPKFAGQFYYTAEKIRKMKKKHSLKPFETQTDSY